MPASQQMAASPNYYSELMVDEEVKVSGAFYQILGNLGKKK